MDYFSSICCACVIALQFLLAPAGQAATVVDKTNRFLQAGARLSPETESLLRLIAGTGASGWKLVSASAGKAGESNVSIMKTADLLNSDPDFAGLMVRCSAQRKIDVVVILVQPLPPQSRPQVTLGAGPNEKVFEGIMTAGGLAVVLPDEAVALAAGAWQSTASLVVAVKSAESEIKGIVAMDGLRPAYGNLVSSCQP